MTIVRLIKIYKIKVKTSFENNIKLLMEKTNKEYNFFNYRGLIISGIKNSDYIEFYIAPKDNPKAYVVPSNMTYNQKNEFSMDNISFSGFVTRLNNFLNGIDKNIENYNNKITKFNKEIESFKAITGNNEPIYKRKDYLEALREDNMRIIEEIDKTTNDKNYISNFKPKSVEIMKMINNQDISSESQVIEYR